jgi:hypothetical protein
VYLPSRSMMARSYCLIIIRKAEMIITASLVIIDAYIPPLRFLKIVLLRLLLSVSAVLL